MTCAACSSHVERALKNLNGVADVKVNLLAGTATIYFELDKAGVEDMVKAINEIDFKVAAEETSLKISGMTCAAL